MSEFNKLSDEELIEEYKELYDLVYVTDCYSVFDLRKLTVIGNILLSRGYEISEKITISINKVK